MKLTKKQIEIKECLNKEWIISNGTGGYCASTVIGANTRRYHGLLVAPLVPPAQRHVLVSKVDESIVIENEEHCLYTNLCPNYTSEGYKYLESFEKEILPIFTYKVKDVKIIKTISMIYNRNTVVVQYKIKNGKKKSLFKITPILNFRDFHGMNTNHDYKLKQKIDKNKNRIEIDGKASTPIYLYTDDGKYIEHHNDKFYNMYYLKEDERGFYPEEDLCVPGRYEIELKPRENKIITFVASLEDNTEQINSEEVIENETKRLEKIISETKLLHTKIKLTKQEKDYNELMKSLIIASDSFIINRPTFGTHSIIAGFPWFLDWGRDTLIAFEGLLLITKRFDLAKEILLTFTRDIKFGLVPNGYSGFDNRPLYNSADASLLLFEQINKYLQYTKDYEFVKENIYPKLKIIIDNYLKGIDLDNNNIYVDEDGTMYYINDSKTIFAIGKKAAETVKPTESTAEEKPATKPSSEATTVVNETKVKPVTKTVKSERSVKLTWKKNKSAKGYVIYAKAGKGKYKKVATVGKKTSKTIKVNKDSSYKFKVKPYKLTKKNKKKYFKAYAAKAKFGSKTVKVTFKNVTGSASYKVEMKAGKAAYKTVKTTTKGGTITYTKKKAKVGTTYKFRLKGINKVNGKTVSVVIK